MDRFEKIEKKIRPIKITWSINYISESIRKSEGALKDKIIASLCKSIKLEQTVPE